MDRFAGFWNVNANLTKTPIRKDGECTVTTPKTCLAPTSSLDLAAPLVGCGVTALSGRCWRNDSEWVVKDRLNLIFFPSQTVLLDLLYEHNKSLPRSRPKLTLHRLEPHRSSWIYPEPTFFCIGVFKFLPAFALYPVQSALNLASHPAFC